MDIFCEALATWLENEEQAEVDDQSIGEVPLSKMSKEHYCQSCESLPKQSTKGSSIGVL